MPRSRILHRVKVARPLLVCGVYGTTLYVYSCRLCSTIRLGKTICGEYTTKGLVLMAAAGLKFSGGFFNCLVPG